MEVKAMKATRKTIPTLIEKRETFSNTGGTVRGIKSPTPTFIDSILSEKTKSQLSEDEKSRLRIDWDTSGIKYIVMSYDTPIAWENEYGFIHKVSQKFSMTTSHHQGLLYLLHRDTP